MLQHINDHRIIKALRIAAVSALLTATGFAQAQASGLASVNEKEAGAAVKAALAKGADAAVGLLGKENGFLGNDKVKIPLPESLQKIEAGLRMFGQQKRADELVVAMNRAAEQAVPQAKTLLSNAVKSMSVEDAKKILSGGEGSVTQFFREKTAAPLAEKFLPIVKQQTAKVELASKYDQLAGQGAKLGIVSQEQASIDHYVTQKALDGLYVMIAEEEQKIRANPVAAGSAVLSKVFGALK
ncbi:DUF4197 domain-containing protein [Parvibium lacunae]|uniref:DUF4197 domain-containing protein n=1 Tax=Parvibium lacunae TaxID=1888893 RepID=A0A368L0P2_9BURK|nr:DUF4197 domain-containing protein [Parvibium lacunae]RCS57119.1 DUF4197 domain-containing protein [Parvibium lacunae]